MGKSWIHTEFRCSRHDVVVRVTRNAEPARNMNRSVTECPNRATGAYYHEDRTHLGLDKETPKERPISSRASPSAKLVELPRLGGLHHRYEWSQAA